MLNLETRNENPLSFHIQTYLAATENQNKTNVTLRRWMELDVIREAALIHVAITLGFIPHSPIQIFLSPPKIWRKCTDLINQIQETPCKRRVAALRAATLLLGFDTLP
jgi:hypothetical protein